MQTRTTSERRNITVPPVIGKALDVLAVRAGHGKTSRVIHELVRAEAVRVIGPNWVKELSVDDDKEAA